MSHKLHKMLHDIKWAQHFLLATIPAFKVKRGDQVDGAIVIGFLLLQTVLSL